MSAIDTCIQDPLSGQAFSPSSLRCHYNLSGMSHRLILDTVKLTRAGISLSEVCGRLNVLAAADVYTVCPACLSYALPKTLTAN